MALGAAMALIEIVAPTWLMLWAGAATVVLGLALWMLPPIDPNWQIAAFIILAPAAAAAGFMIKRKRGMPEPQPDVNIGVARFIGQVATLETPIENGRGSARLGDTVWPVSGPDMPAGTPVHITATDGVTLVVAR
jgi:membrane protein implicated in regulation of membrane protease activity